MVSILLAFWIDAWWQEQVELRESTALIRGLHADFESSQEHLSEWLDGNKRAFVAAQELLAEIRKTPVGDDIEVPLEWVQAAMITATYDPTDTSLRTAVATGRIELIMDPALRNALADWRQQLDDTQEDEALVRHIVVNQLVPILAQQIRIAGALEYDRLFNWFTGRQQVELDGQFTITVTTELEGALAQKLFYSQFIVDGLATIGDTQAEVLQQLEQNF